MRPLVAVRRGTAFDPQFLGRSLLFWPLARAARALKTCDDFPSAGDLMGVFEATPPVRFVAAGPARRRREPIDARSLYDGRVTLEGVVPTRARCWHDFMNALVWGTFPRAKRALHARQYRAIAARLVPGATRLPPVRSPELDALALLDEGGIAVLATDPERVRAALATRGPDVLRAEVEAGTVLPVIFGHAIYESLALGVAPAVAAAIVLARDPSEPDAVRDADARLARAIEDGAILRSPRELTRVDVQQAIPRAARSSDARASASAAEPK
jgi:hypothetical protein